jgi:hypothetical protein
LNERRIWISLLVRICPSIDIVNSLTDMHCSFDLNLSFNPLLAGQQWCYQPNLTPPFIISFYLALLCQPGAALVSCRHGRLLLLLSLHPRCSSTATPTAESQESSSSGPYSDLAVGSLSFSAGQPDSCSSVRIFQFSQPQPTTAFPSRRVELTSPRIHPYLFTIIMDPAFPIGNKPASIPQDGLILGGRNPCERRTHTESV